MASPIRERRGMEVDRRELERILGLSGGSVDGFIRAGLPFIRRGGPGVSWLFNTADVVDWIRDNDYIKRNPQFNDPNRKLSAEAAARTSLAQAQLREYELGEKQGVLVNIEDLRPTAEAQLSGLRARLMEMPARLVTDLVGESDPRQIEDLIKAEVREALDEIQMDVEVVLASAA